MASSQASERNRGIGRRLVLGAGTITGHAHLRSGDRVFAHDAVQGTWRVLEGPNDVLDLMDTGAEGVVALVRDAGATFLSPIFHELTGVVCTGGTPRSHIGIVSREFQVPCLMACVLDRRAVRRRGGRAGLLERDRRGPCLSRSTGARPDDGPTS